MTATELAITHSCARLTLVVILITSWADAGARARTQDHDRRGVKPHVSSVIDKFSHSSDLYSLEHPKDWRATKSAIAQTLVPTMVS